MATMSPIDILEGARDLLSEKDSWIQEVSSLSASGRYIIFSDDSACQFCLTGALRRSVYDLMLDEDENSIPDKPDYHVVYELVDRNGVLSQVLKVLTDMIKKNFKHENNLRGNIVTFNDQIGRTYADILCLIDLALKEFKS